MLAHQHQLAQVNAFAKKFVHWNGMTKKQTNEPFKPNFNNKGYIKNETKNLQIFYEETLICKNSSRNPRTMTNYWNS